jgi:hypothetical protein
MRAVISKPRREAEVVLDDEEFIEAVAQGPGLILRHD